MTAAARYVRWLCRKRLGGLTHADPETQHIAALLLTGMIQPVITTISTVTEFERAKLAAYTVPDLMALKTALDSATRSKSVSDAQAQMLALGSTIGEFEVWTDRPVQAHYQRLARAGQQPDFDDYLRHFCDKYLGVWKPNLAPYLAATLLGIHVKDGEVLMGGIDLKLLQGDDAELCAVLLGRAHRRQRHDQLGERDPAVHPPGAEPSRVPDAMTLAVSASDITNLFGPPELEPATVMATALLDALNREDWEKVGRRLGLPRDVMRFAARLSTGWAKPSDNPRATGILRQNQDAIRAAIASDSAFGG